MAIIMRYNQEVSSKWVQCEPRKKKAPITFLVSNDGLRIAASHACIHLLVYWFYLNGLSILCLCSALFWWAYQWTLQNSRRRLDFWGSSERVPAHTLTSRSPRTRTGRMLTARHEWDPEGSGFLYQTRGPAEHPDTSGPGPKSALCYWWKFSLRKKISGTPVLSEKIPIYTFEVQLRVSRAVQKWTLRNISVP